MKIGREFIVLHAELRSVLGASRRLGRKSYVILGVFPVFPVYPSLRSEDNTELRKSYHCSSQKETFIEVCDNFMSERSSNAGAFRAVLCYVDNIDVLQRVPYR